MEESYKKSDQSRPHFLTFTAATGQMFLQEKHIRIPSSYRYINNKVESHLQEMFENQKAEIMNKDRVMGEEKPKKSKYDFWELLTDIRFIATVIIVILALLYKLGILAPSQLINATMLPPRQFYKNSFLILPGRLSNHKVVLKMIEL